MNLAEAIQQFVPGGFRDEDGVWHEGPHRLEATRQLDALVDFVRRTGEGDFGRISGEGLEIANEILAEFERTVQ